MCELCEEEPNGAMQSCQDCGVLICFDIESGDDVIRSAYVTNSGDLYCDRCGSRYDRMEEEEENEEDWDELTTIP